MTKRILTRLALFLVSVGLSLCIADTDVLATTWHVPEDVPLIYAAVDSASYGDTVLVAPGTYERERDKFDENWNSFWIEMRDGVTLMSEGGPTSVTLVETGEGPFNYVITCDSITGAEVIGFTLVVGPPAYDAICNTGIAMTSSDVTISGNVVSGFWYGISVYGDVGTMERPLIEGNDIDCLVGINVYACATGYSPSIHGNAVHGADIGIRVEDASPYIRGNVISGCQNSGVYFRGFSESLMWSNQIINNGSYGVYAWTEGWFFAPCLNCGGTPQTANDVYGNGLRDVYYKEDTGRGLFLATCNYWGTNCPDSSRFYGQVDWNPWVDSAHEDICTDCENCGNAIDPTTWGSIKAMFK